MRRSRVRFPQAAPVKQPRSQKNPATKRADLHQESPGLNKFETSFSRELRKKIERQGGLFNAHLHLDRSGSLAFVRDALAAENLSTGHSALSLESKHSLITLVHDSDLFREDKLKARTAEFLTALVKSGARRADTSADVTADGLGTRSLSTLLALKAQFSEQLDLRVGAYNPLGFRDDIPERWELIVEGSRQSDFIVGLPERDDRRRYPDHIGFDNSVKRLISLGIERGQEVHLHADQSNSPHSNESERIFDILDQQPWGLSRGQLWLVHVISPSTYKQERFHDLLKRIQSHGVGVIVCPSAAISMRQIRNLHLPAGNSIARVLEFLAAGIEVRLGSDNVDDITSPAGTIDLREEIYLLAHAIRYFDTDVLASLGCGAPLSEAQRAGVVRHLKASALEEAAMLDFFSAQHD